MMFVPHRKHAYGPPRLVTGLSLLFYVRMMFVPHRKHTYGPPRPVTGIALLFYVDDVRTSQETLLCTSAACYGDNFTFFMCG
jgi:hypothetical protein